MHVLLIEDNPRDVDLARIALARSGLPCGLIAVPDGDAALDHLGRRGDGDPAPVMVFLDLNLGASRGSGLIAAIRALPGMAWLPIVILTTSNDPLDVAECYRRGANAYMVKSIDFARFAEGLRGAVRFWARVNCRPR